MYAFVFISWLFFWQPYPVWHLVFKPKLYDQVVSGKCGICLHEEQGSKKTGLELEFVWSYEKFRNKYFNVDNCAYVYIAFHTTIKLVI